MYLEMKSNRTHRKSIFHFVTLIEINIDRWRIIHGNKVTVLAVFEYSVVRILPETPNEEN